MALSAIILPAKTTMAQVTYENNPLSNDFISFGQGKSRYQNRGGNNEKVNTWFYSGQFIISAGPLECSESDRKP